jgi:hypothetical protein
VKLIETSSSPIGGIVFVGAHSSDLGQKTFSLDAKEGCVYQLKADVHETFWDGEILGPGGLVIK